jgi:hypothetical protein
MRSRIAVCFAALIASLSEGAAHSQIALTGPAGYQWDIDTQGPNTPGTSYAGTGCVINGTSDETDEWPFLCVRAGAGPMPPQCAVDDVYNAGDVAPTTDLGGRRVILASELVAGLTVHREVYVPSTGTIDFARFMDVLENATAAPITVSVRYGTALAGTHNNDLGSDDATSVTSTSDGDTIIEVTDTYFCTDDETDGGWDMSLGHVVQGLRRRGELDRGAIDDLGVGDASDVGVDFDDVVVPAGGRVVFFFFLVQAPDRATAETNAAELDVMLSWPAEATAGLEPEDLDDLYNFSADMNILWYDDFEETDYEGSIREYLESRGHFVEYHDDDTSLDLSDPSYEMFEVLVVEHTCWAPTSTLGLEEWISSGRGYVVLLADYHYESPLDDYVMSLLGVTTDGVPTESPFGNTEAWEVANLAWVDPGHPIANFPNGDFLPSEIVQDQVRYHVGLPAGVPVVRDPVTGADALAVQESIAGPSTSAVAILGTNFHGASRSDPETRMLVENMIAWTVGRLDLDDTDRDGYAGLDGDCDDTDPAINPGAVELCNGVDDDCDSTSVDGSAEAWFDAACDGPDSDACTEGRYECSAAAQQCTDVTGDDIELCNGIDDDCRPTSADGSDEPWYRDPCDGSDADLCLEGVLGCTGGMPVCTDITGDAEESCNGVDDDCDGVIPAGEEDADGDGSHVCDGDCDDGDPAFHPGADETDCSDPNDYNCDGSVGYADRDGDGFAACEECDDTDSAVHPGASELCDGTDDDCDPGTPDGAGEAWFEQPCDGDDADVCEEGIFECAGSTSHCTDDTGHNTELCNGLDDDCDGVTPADETDDDGDGFRVCELDCVDDDPAINPGAVERCNGTDDDCDDQVDEGDVCGGDADADGDSDGDSDADADADSGGDADADADAGPDGGGDADADSDGDGGDADAGAPTEPGEGGCSCRVSGRGASGPRVLARVLDLVLAR